MTTYKEAKLVVGNPDGSTNKILQKNTEKGSHANREIEFINKYSQVKVSITKDCDKMEIKGLYADSPKTVYFLGLQMDVDTGCILSSYNQNEGGFILLSFYDLMRIEIPNFDKDVFLANLEELKMNRIGEKKPGSFADICELLFTNTHSNISSDISGSICRNALKSMGTQSKKGEKVDRLDSDFFKDLSVKIFIHMQMCLDIRRNIRFLIRRDVENLRPLDATKLDKGSDRNMKKDRLTILEDEEGIFNTYYIYSETSESSNFVENYFIGDNYASFFEGNPGAFAEFFASNPNSLDLMAQGADWAYDNTYNKINTKHDKAYKEGKAIKLFSNLNELLRASKKQDEEMELYNTLSEDYDVAKKAIKKTSFKDIIKGSYLTNILKNVSSIFNINKHGRTVDNTGIVKTIGFYTNDVLAMHMKANNHLVQIIRKALSVL